MGKREARHSSRAGPIFAFVRLLSSRLRHRWFIPVLALLILVGSSAVVFAQAPSGAVGVYYVGVEDAIAEAINLATPHIVRVDQPELAQVLIINNFLPHEEETLRLFSSQAQRGDVGLVIFCGSQYPQTVGDLRVLLGVSTFGMSRSDRPRAIQLGSEADPLQRAVAWNSAPPIQARTVISNPNLLVPIITTSAQEPILQRIRGREETQVFIVGGWFNTASNAEWQNWPYFRYLVYRLIVEAANAPRVLAFANYPLSPVPHGRLRIGLVGGSIGLTLLVAWGLYRATRYLFLHPGAEDEVHLATTARVSPGDWARAGFHRPLAGFLALATPYLLLLVLLILYRFDTLPRTLVPWGQTLRFWEVTARWFDVVWLLFDFGTGVATVYYFARLRARYFREAFRFFRFYVWWQLLSGVVQVAGITTFATVILPGTALAHLSFYLIAHALIQFPGFFQVFRLFFRAMQRLDYESYLTFLATMGPIALQSTAIVLMRRWGAAHPAIGEALGSVLGLGLGLYLTETLVFIVGVLLYMRMGYSLRALLLPAFDRHVVRRVLSFGGQLTFGAVFIPLALLVQNALLPQLIPTYGEGLPDRTLARYFVAAFDLLALGLYHGLMPAMVEAQAHGYKTLLRYYVGQGLHYGMWISVFLLAGLSAIGGRVVLGIFGTPYAGAAQWLIPLLGWGALQWPAWLANQTLVATGHPAVTSWLTIVEQGLRLGLMVVLVPGQQMMGVVLALVVALVVRVIVAWIIVQRHIGRPRIYIWQTLVAPAGAATSVHYLLRAAVERWWTPTFSFSIILMLAGLLLGLVFYGFLTALFGGWDDGGLAELRRATRISGIGLPLAWLLAMGIRLGAYSPLHGLFPMAVRPLAEEEARALTLGVTHST